jgi:hypothetical protein
MKPHKPNVKDEKAATDRRIEITTWMVAGSSLLQAIVLIVTVIVMVRTRGGNCVHT